MDKIGQLERAKALLSQALNAAAASMPNNRSVIEASGQIRSAIRTLDGVSKVQLQKRKMNQTQFETWWGNVQAGTAKAAQANTAHQGVASMSAEARQKNLAQLNSMIAKEQNKLDELEKSVTTNPTPPDQLLQD